MSKATVIVLGLILTVLASVWIMLYIRKPIVYKRIPPIVIKTKPFLAITTKTLAENIEQYKGISNKNKSEILFDIVKYSKQYKLNPIVIYSLIATESSFKFWIKHSLVTIVVKKHKIKTRAIGLGGVIWEWYEDELIQNKIAQVKSDLFDISTNIQATCYIYRKLKDEAILKGSKDKQESARIRYFGGGLKNRWYADKINKVLASLLKQEL